MIERGKGDDSDYLLVRPGCPTAGRRHRLDGGGVMTTDEIKELEAKRENLAKELADVDRQLKVARRVQTASSTIVTQRFVFRRCLATATPIVARV